MSDSRPVEKKIIKIAIITPRDKYGKLAEALLSTISEGAKADVTLQSFTISLLQEIDANKSNDNELQAKIFNFIDLYQKSVTETKNGSIDQFIIAIKNLIQWKKDHPSDHIAKKNFQDFEFSTPGTSHTSQQQTTYDSPEYLDLSVERHFYWAMKFLKRHFGINHANEEVKQITLDDIRKLLMVEGNKYQLHDTTQQTEWLAKLAANLNAYFSNKMSVNEMKYDLVMEQVIRNICIGSTAKGSRPFLDEAINIDAYRFSQAFKRKMHASESSSKYSYLPNEYIDSTSYYDNYGGSGNVARGLKFIDRYMAFKVSDIKKFHDYVIKKLSSELPQKVLFGDTKSLANTYLTLIKDELSELKSLQTESIFARVLSSVLDGYQQIHSQEFLSNSKDRTINILVLREIHELMKKFKNCNENEANLIYRSCIDLFSVAITQYLRNNQNILNNEKNLVSGSVYSFDNANINISSTLIGDKGSLNLYGSLSIIDNYYGINSDHNSSTKYPGFKLTTVFTKVASENDKENMRKDDIAAYFELGGTRGQGWFPGNKGNVERVALVGRHSETAFDITAEDLEKLTKDVSEWCQKNKETDKPFTLCVDTTLRKAINKDELINWVFSKEIQSLVEQGKLNIIMWQSEQKQQSLGVGKFSAGSSFIISADKSLVNEFNNKSKNMMQQAPDYNLSTFFRLYCSEAMDAVVEQQSISVKYLTLKLNDILSVINNSESNVKINAIENGPFLTLIVNGDNPEQVANRRDQIFSLLKAIWPVSFSFGFSKTSITHYDDQSIRVSVGLESKSLFDKDLEMIEGRIKSLSDENRLAKKQ